MDTVIRTAAIYLLLWLLFRIAGRRTLSEMTTFDFVLLLIVAEAVQQAIIGDDFSVTTAVLAIVTLLALDISVAAVQQRRPRVDRWLNGVPTVIVADGQPLGERMDRARIDIADVMEAARRQGIERMDQIKFAVLERGGGISVIPKS
jgi:uncharacterized membrane protein YcaP (DUF421 family)